MKMRFLAALLLFSVINLPATQAQIHVNINIGRQPVWGPVGYDYAENYYLPDIETYYNVPQRQFTYWDNGRWVTSGGLPARYSNYDLYNGYKVVINEPRPYLRNDIYRVKYAPYKNRHDQDVIRDSRDDRYYENRDHPRHDQWKSNGHDNRDKKGNHGNGRGNDRDNGNGKDRD